GARDGRLELQTQLNSPAIVRLRGPRRRGGAPDSAWRCHRDVGNGFLSQHQPRSHTPNDQHQRRHQEDQGKFRRRRRRGRGYREAQGLALIGAIVWPRNVDYIEAKTIVPRRLRGFAPLRLRNIDLDQKYFFLVNLEVTIRRSLKFYPTLF